MGDRKLPTPVPVGAVKPSPPAAPPIKRIGIDMTSLRSRPDPIPCPKCGGDSGWKGPRYDNVRAMTIAVMSRGRGIGDAALMVWHCRQCGYERWTKPLDARAPERTVQRRSSFMERLFAIWERA